MEEAGSIYATNPQVYADHYDMFAEKTKQDIPFYLEYARKCGLPILELAVGTGRVAIPIARQGFEVYGIDICQEMLEVAKQKIEQEPKEVQERLHLSEGDMRKFKLEKKFNLIFVAYRSFQALTSMEEQEQCLTCVRDHLDDEGLFIAHIFAPRHDILSQQNADFRFVDSVIIPETKEKITWMERTTRDLAREVLHVENLYDHVYPDGTVQHFENSFTLTYIHRREMILLLDKNGFLILDCFGQFDKRPYDYYSGEMIFVTKKEESIHGD